MRILIVEDDILISEMIKEMVIDLGHEVLDQATSFDEAIAALERNSNIDLAILDIQLGLEKSGLKIANEIHTSKRCPFIFLTSYSDKAIIAEALSFKPKAYLVKPFSEIDLYTTLEIIQAQTDAAPKSIVIKDGVKQSKILSSDILWIKSDNIYLEIFTKEKKHLVRNSLERMIKKINDDCIKRIHRSYAVNINKIESVRGNFVHIHGQEIPIARNLKGEIISIYMES